MFGRLQMLHIHVLLVPKVESLEYRIHQMATPQYRRIGSGYAEIPIENRCYLLEDYQNIQDGSITKIEYLGTFHLTEFGRKELQQHQYSTKTARKELWLKNAWIPIIVAFLTTLLTNYMLPKLLQMLESLFRNLG